MGSVRRVIAAIVVTAFFAFYPQSSTAHAVLVEASPTPGSVVPAPELDVRLRFNTRIDHERSSLTLIGPGGERKVDIGSATTPPAVIVGKLSELTPGKYRLRWQVLAVDGHITRGDVEFEVRAP